MTEQRLTVSWNGPRTVVLAYDVEPFRHYVGDVEGVDGLRLHLSRPRIGADAWCASILMPRFVTQLLFAGAAHGARLQTAWWSTPQRALDELRADLSNTVTWVRDVLGLLSVVDGGEPRSSGTALRIYCGRRTFTEEDPPCAPRVILEKGGN